MLNQTHDPDAKSWVAEANDHAEFPVQNLPLGTFAPRGEDDRRGAVAIGDRVLCLRGAASLLDGAAADAARLADAASLNALFAQDNAAADALRLGLFVLLTNESRAAETEKILFDATECDLSVPFEVGDYTDFYTGIEHARNVGALFRPDNPLLPNYKYVPIGYHGRASSIRASGAEVIRPTGQTRSAEGSSPHFKPSERLDYEMEMAVWTSGANPLGQPISIGDAASHVAGLSILNDWSARDLQAWEYQPLGPFLAKNFLSTVSPWLVTSAALDPFRIAQPARPEGDPRPLDYLWDDADQQSGAYNVSMEVLIQTAAMRKSGMAPHRLSKGSMTAMYWTAAQLIAHHTVNGCNLRAGDLLGTGTLSGPDASTFGSLLELSNGGKNPLALPSGEMRTFLEDGDEIVMRAHGEAQGARAIGFGECRGKDRQPMTLTLHGYWRSGTSYRTRIALNLKGVAYDQVTHDLRKGEQKDAAYTALQPQGLVPALEVRAGFVIPQSVAILEWLEETYPDPPLLPRNADERALVRAMCAVIGSDMHPLNNLRVLKMLKAMGHAQDAIDGWARHWIAEGFRALDTMIGTYGSPYAYGTTPTLADCYLVPQVYSAERFGADLSPYDNLMKAYDAAIRHPAVAAAHPDKQPDAE